MQARVPGNVGHLPHPPCVTTSQVSTFSYITRLSSVFICPTIQKHVTKLPRIDGCCRNSDTTRKAMQTLPKYEKPTESRNIVTH